MPELKNVVEGPIYRIVMMEYVALIRPGDVILSVDGRSVYNITLKVFDRSGDDRPGPDPSWITKYEEDACEAQRERNYWTHHRDKLENPDQAVKVTSLAHIGDQVRDGNKLWQICDVYFNNEFQRVVAACYDTKLKTATLRHMR